MKIKCIPLFFLLLFYLSIFAQNTSGNNPDIKTKTTIINDTIEVSEINGKMQKTVFRTTSGKTLTIKEKDELYDKYKTLGHSFAKESDYLIVTLYTPMDKEKIDSIKNSHRGDSARMINNFLTRWMNKPIGNIQLTDINDKKYNLGELNGNVVVLNFWFVGCMPCIKEMPELNKVVNDLKGKKVIFFAVALDSKEKILEFLKAREFSYQQISPSKISKDLGIYAWPTHLVIDKSGIIRYIQIGGDDIKDKLEQNIEMALK